MTTATESHDAQLAAIKARHEELRKQVNELSLAVGTIITPDISANYHQLGLDEVRVDKIGRLWRQMGVQGMELIFDPYARGSLLAPVDDRLPVRPTDPDDTQAAQGFKAHG